MITVELTREEIELLRRAWIVIDQLGDFEKDSTAFLRIWEKAKWAEYTQEEAE